MLLGTGERAQRLVQGLRQNPEAWGGDCQLDRKN